MRNDHERSGARSPLQEDSQMFDRKRWPLLATMLLVLAFALTGCSDDDDDNPTNPGNGGDDAPEFMGVEAVTLPQAMQDSTDPYAIMASSYVNQINLIAGYSTIFTPPSNKAAADGPPWVWTWTYNDDVQNVTVTLTADEVDGFYTWEMVYDGTVDGMTFNDAVVYRARQAVDGSSGDFWLHDIYEGSGEVLIEWHWTSSGADTDFEMIAWSGNESIRIVMSFKGDTSGDVDIFEGSAGNWVIQYHFEWTEAGTGSWAEYENGQLVDSGTWGVPTKAAALRD
jgi:hypothetical protein